MAKKRAKRPIVLSEFGKLCREVYFIEAEGLGLVKIGWAVDSRKRCADLQVGCPVRLILRGVHVSDDYRELERMFHEHHAEQWERGEWFRIDEKLRYFMDECLFEADAPSVRHRKICWTITPQPHVEPLVRVERLPGESTRAFAYRATEALNAA